MKRKRISIHQAEDARDLDGSYYELAADHAETDPGGEEEDEGRQLHRGD